MEAESLHGGANAEASSLVVLGIECKHFSIPTRKKASYFLVASRFPPKRAHVIG